MMTSEGKTMFIFTVVWRGTRRTLLLAVGLATALVLSSAFAQESAVAWRTVPNALLSIDQNRSTVVERIVGEWGAELAASPTPGSRSSNCGRRYSGMRADYLLAASVAGSLEGLRNVVASSLIGTTPVPGKVGTKALGDTGDDLVYTPVMPCRIVDTRNVGGPFAGGETRNYHAYLTSGTFATQAARRATAESQRTRRRWRSTSRRWGAGGS